MLIDFLYKIFYILPILFIWSEFYHLKYKNRLYIRFNQRQIGNSTLVDYIFYLTRIVYLLWILIGIFSDNSISFLLILFISSIKFLLLFFKSRRISDNYDSISTIICIIILLYLFLKVNFLINALL